MRLETLAASKLIQAMLSKNASQEELDNAKKYLLSAVKYDVASLELTAVAKETSILCLASKYALSVPAEKGNGNCLASALQSPISVHVDIPANSAYDFSKTKVGDTISVDLEELGSFTATAYEVTDDDILFIFDDYIAKRPMNSKDTNEGGYENSDLRKWIEIHLYSLFPQELKKRLIELTLPTVGQVFGWEDEWNQVHLEPDGDTQLSLMKQRCNRVAYFNNECEWGWLRNATKKAVSSAGFASVTHNGRANCYYASNSRGVRPAFRLKK